MGIVEKIFNKIGYFKAKRISDIFGSNRLFDITQFGAPIPDNYTKYLTAYRNEVWVYACVYVIATTIAGLPYKLMHYERRNGKLEKREYDDHPVEILINKPNRNDANSTWFNLLEWTIASMELTGNAYWLQDEMVNGIPYSLHWLIPSKVRVKPGQSQYVDGYIYQRDDSRKVIFQPDEISHFKYMSVNDYYYGQSSISPCRWSIDTIKEAQRTNLSIFRNGAKLDGVLESEHVLPDPVFKRVQEQFNQKYVGVDKSHGTAILEKGLKYKTIVASMQELEFINGIKLSREDICACFGVPPVLVGILDRATYNNYSESLKIFWTNTVIPKLKRLEPIITAIVKKYDENAFFEFDISNVEALKEDEKTKSEIAKTYFSMGVPLNEIIQAFNLPFSPVKGGDVGYLPLNLMPITIPERSQDEPEKQKQLVKGTHYTPEKKLMLWKQFDRLTSQIMKRYHKIIEEFFTSQEKKVIRNLEKESKRQNNPIFQFPA